MKSLILFGALALAQFAFATLPPANYPIVKGEVRKVDLVANRVSIKHEAIPNLEMGPMTMSFLAKDPQLLKGFAPGDKINFVADQIDDELTVLWLEKAQAPEQLPSQVLCTGVAPTNPKTGVEIKVRSDTFSTIQYEYLEGAYKGSTHINSIGDMVLHRTGDLFVYQSGDDKFASTLSFKLNGEQITEAMFSNFSSGMNKAAVQCSFEQ